MHWKAEYILSTLRTVPPLFNYLANQDSGLFFFSYISEKFLGYMYTNMHLNMAAGHNKVGNACNVVASLTLLLILLRHTRLANVVLILSSLDGLLDALRH
jgi:hypothetical protein